MKLQELHNTELQALYSSPDIIRNIKSRRLRWAGHVARMDESRNVYRVLVGRPEGKRPLGRPRRKWEDNIKMDLRKVGYDDRDWINLAQDRDQWRIYVRVAMNLRCAAGLIESQKKKLDVEITVFDLWISIVTCSGKEIFCVCSPRSNPTFILTGSLQNYDELTLEKIRTVLQTVYHNTVKYEGGAIFITSSKPTHQQLLPGVRNFCSGYPAASLYYYTFSATEFSKGGQKQARHWAITTAESKDNFKTMLCHFPRLVS
ncbi:hypothetical protein ANN_06091 [Periplaneta americana]|uniref:Uncharacterized protein n=1 Tax=Periplaneta americana TaxID=6978 RepID=A0ABQ8TCL0_PERAM|nr:hypothetical protein ANN_06091 [Periplaneta americana]